MGKNSHLAIYQGIRAGEGFARARMQQRGDYFAAYQDYAGQPFIYDGGEQKRKRSPLLYRKVMQWLEQHEASVERGERNISALNLMQIAVTLRVEVGELFPKAEEFKGLLEAQAVEEDQDLDHGVPTCANPSHSKAAAPI